MQQLGIKSYVMGPVRIWQREKYFPDKSSGTVLYVFCGLLQKAIRSKYVQKRHLLSRVQDTGRKKTYSEHAEQYLIPVYAGLGF